MLSYLLRHTMQILHYYYIGLVFFLDYSNSPYILNVCGGSGSNVTVHVLNGGGSVQSIFDNDETIYSSSSGGSPPLAASGWYAEGTSTGDECGKWSNSGSGSWVSGFQGQCGQ